MLLKFYINYEECKLILILYNLKISFSFILTMRNVNENILSMFAENELGFILTMRNVNGYGKTIAMTHELCFILTMRNVNL